MFKWFDQRFHIVEGVRNRLNEDELGIARAEGEELPGPVEKVEARPEVSVESLKSFTLQELQCYDGTEGRPIYLGYKGRVYDLSASPLFQGTQRMRCHIAGKDLTREIEMAPHGEDLVLKFPLVGRLV